MLESEKLAIAAHLHVVMRRKIGRVTDVEWILRSPEYAREVIRLGLANPAHTDLVDWANRLHAAMFEEIDRAARQAAAAAAAAAEEAAAQAAGDRGEASGFEDSRLGRMIRASTAPRYVGTLR